jgi:hypothetical protein
MTIGDLINAYCCNELSPSNLDGVELKTVILNKDSITKFLEECKQLMLENLRNGVSYDYVEPEYTKQRDSFTEEGKEFLPSLLGEKAYSKRLITPKQALQILGSEKLSPYIIKGEHQINNFKIK